MAALVARILGGAWRPEDDAPAPSEFELDFVTDTASDVFSATTYDEDDESIPRLLTSTVSEDEDDGDSPSFLHILPSLIHERCGERLSVEIGQLFGLDNDEHDEEDLTEPEIDLEHPLFTCVTHDEVDVENEEPARLAWLLSASALPALTHLSFNTQPNPLFLEKIPTNNHRLRVLMVAFSAKEEDAAVGFIEEITGIADPRLVVATHAHYYSDWEIGVRGGDDIWIRAEEFLLWKQCGEVEEGDYFAQRRDPHRKLYGRLW
ncbi:hypothetical protein MVEN_02256100 [Mycena venus]|uniref:Uncharacterized protein n=1 Tax=Mycena venus TaxID=2733690 RepID=A0A8H6X6T7_9AGAR|nr:hypothetical protein MVEN_02256100 [Mycena venus]